MPNVINLRAGYIISYIGSPPTSIPRGKRRASLEWDARHVAIAQSTWVMARALGCRWVGWAAVLATRAAGRVRGTGSERALVRVAVPPRPSRQAVPRVGRPAGPDRHELARHLLDEGGHEALPPGVVCEDQVV